MNNVSLGSEVLKPLNRQMPIVTRKSKYHFKSEYLPRPTHYHRISMPSVSVTSLAKQSNKNYKHTESTPRDGGSHLGSPLRIGT